MGNVPVPEAHLVLLAVTGALERHRRIPLQVRGARPVGAAALLLGLGLAAGATVAAGDVDLSRPGAVVSTGAYRWSRHPMYVGWTLVYAGVVLGGRSTWGVLLTPLLATLVVVEANAEERRMLARFPVEYAEYQARVPRFVGPRRA